MIDRPHQRPILSIEFVVWYGAQKSTCSDDYSERMMVKHKIWSFLHGCIGSSYPPKERDIFSEFVSYCYGAVSVRPSVCQSVSKQFVSTAISWICLDECHSFCTWSSPMVRSWCTCIRFLIQCCMAGCWLFFSAGSLSNVTTAISLKRFDGFDWSSPMMKSWCTSVRFFIRCCMADLWLL